MLSRRVISPFMVMGFALSLCGGGCIFNPPGDKVIPLPPPPYPDQSRPENLIEALEAIYDDKLRNATERLHAYQDRLAPQNFKFIFQEADRPSCGCIDWGRDEEIQTHQNIFQKQDSNEIYSLELDIEYSPATDHPDSTGWKEIFVSSVYLRLLTSPDDGFLVNGGQADFVMEPIGDLWYIREWEDQPRP